MASDPFDGWVEIRLEDDHYMVPPGKTVEIPVNLTNRGAVVDHLEFSLEGIPPDWLGAPLPIIMLTPGEHRQVSLVIQPPGFPQVRAGAYALLLRVASLRLQARFLEVDLRLTVAAAHSPGPVAAFLAQTDFQMQAGHPVSFPLIVANWGFQPDQFAVHIEGIPAQWYKASPRQFSLDTGAEMEVTITLSPPLHAESRAGEHAFKVIAQGKASADQPASLDCQMKLAPFYAYHLDLLPPVLPPGEAGVVQVQNLGNTEDIYTLQFEHPEDGLDFYILSPPATPIGMHRDVADQPHVDPWGIAEPEGKVRIKGDQTGAYKGLLLRIPAGERLGIDFLPVAHKPPAWQDQQEPFVITVESARLAQQRQEGIVTVAPVAYPWLVRIMIGMFFVAFALTFWFLAMFVREAGISMISATSTPTLPIPVIVWTDTPTPTNTPTWTVVPSLVPPTSTSTPSQTLTPTATLVSSFTPGVTLTAATTVTPTAPTATRLPLTPAVTIPVFPIQNMGRLALESNLTGAARVYIYDTRKLTFEALHENVGPGMQPAWSPDGSQVAFVTSLEGNNEIYVLTLASGLVFNLTNNQANDLYPSWSPDGRRIAFTSNRTGNQEIFAVDVNTQTAVNLTNNGANDLQPNWFVDQRIAFTSDRDGNQEIYLMNSDGSGQTNLTKNGGNDSDPAGAWNINTIAFVSDRNGNTEIFSMSLDGSNQTNLTTSPYAEESPAWSPNFDWIAFTTNRNGDWDIYVIRRDGTQPYKVTSLPSDEKYPAWTGVP